MTLSAAPDPAALYAGRRYAEAAAGFAARAAARPADADAWVGLSQSWLAAGRPADALPPLGKARALVRGDAVAVVELLAARAHAACGHVDRAEAAFKAALAVRADAKTLSAFGTFLCNAGRLDEATALLTRAVKLGDRGEALASLATTHTLAGRSAEALALLAGEPRRSPALALAWARAAVAAGRAAEALGPLEAALAEAPPAHHALLHHARAQALDALDDVPAAAAAFTAMHRARGVSPDPARITAEADAVIRAYATAPARPQPTPGPRPVFLVGLPRSGTSLCEQALAAHPAVHAAGERDELRRLTLRLGEAFGVPWPACAAQVPKVAAQGAALWREAVGARADAAVVTDKMPDNHLRLGLAAQLFGAAEAVWVRRGVEDTLLSCWQQAFGPAHAWTASWEGLAAMADSVERVGTHWLETRPMPVTVVTYEALVTEPEAELRELCARLGLGWDAAVTRPDKVERTVRTASITQVRAPIHASRVARWRRWEHELAPLWERLARPRG